MIERWLVELTEKLSRLTRKRLNVSALAFSVERIECQR
jgi:hypothetical protein